MFVSVKPFKLEDPALALDQLALEYCSEYFKNMNKDFSYGVLIMSKRLIFFTCTCYAKHEVDVHALIISLVIYVTHKLIA